MQLLSESHTAQILIPEYRMKQLKTHLLFLPYEEFYQTLCNIILYDKTAITKDSTKVTCKTCLKAYFANKKQREESHD